MVRVYLLLVLVAAILGFWGLNWFKNTPAEIVGKKLKRFAWFAALLLLLGLAVSGKLNGLFALLGVAIAFVIRWLPTLERYAPQMQRWWMWFQSGRCGPQTKPPSGSGLSRAEALDILGLKPGASEAEIIAAHRKLIARLHPDKGGSDYLAAQINLAKKVLLTR